MVPSDLVDYFAAAKSIATRHAPVLEQAVLADFIADGHFGGHVRYARGPAAREGVQMGSRRVDERELRRGVRERAVALWSDVAARLREAVQG